MKIKRGTNEVKLPSDFSLVESVCFIPHEDEIAVTSAATYPLTQVRPEEIKQIQASPSGKIIGLPRYFAIIRGYVDPKSINACDLHLWPRTDRDGNLRIRYRPPSKEI